MQRAESHEPVEARGESSAVRPVRCMSRPTATRGRVKRSSAASAPSASRSSSLASHRDSDTSSVSNCRGEMTGPAWGSVAVAMRGTPASTVEHARMIARMRGIGRMMRKTVLAAIPIRQCAGACGLGSGEAVWPGVSRLPPGAFCAVCAGQANRKTGHRAPSKTAAAGVQLRIVLRRPMPRGSVPSPAQEAPGGSPGTPGTTTTPPSMP